MKIILGSASPRRHELLKGLDIEFTIDSKSNSDESYDPNMPHHEIPEYLAKKKSYGFHRAIEDDELLITADTMVFCQEEILGKPKDRAEAVKMLRFLSGKTHTVLTGVYLRTSKRESSFTATTDVTFKKLTTDEIDYYLDNYKPYDKAGSYGVQEWIGYIAITGISGSYFNVMGLPIQKLYEELKRYL